MATARVSESLWNCTKRWALEAALTKAGHKWPNHRARQPMSAAECVCRILAWLDQRSDPSGNISDAQPEDVELAAAWPGGEGVLYAALVETGWIDEDGLTRRWHDYGSYNGNTIRDRNKKRGRRPGTGRGHRSDLVGDEVGDKVGASGSGSVVRVEGPESEKESPDLSAGADRAVVFPPVVMLWNRTVSGSPLPTVRTWSAARGRIAAARLSEEPDLNLWGKAFALLAASPHHRGQNDRGWVADIDFIFQAKQAPKWLDMARGGAPQPEARLNGKPGGGMTTAQILEYGRQRDEQA